MEHHTSSHRPITHRVLKNEQGRVFRELPVRGAVEIRNRDTIDGILLSPAEHARLHALAARAQALDAALPVLLDAARTGTALSAEELARLNLPTTGLRPPGSLRGRIHIAEDFDEPLEIFADLQPNQ